MGHEPVDQLVAEKINNLAKILAAILDSVSETTRLKILFMLGGRGEMSVTDIGRELGQSQPAVSHHLALLRAAGLIEYRRAGKFNYYSLHPAGLRDLLDRVFLDEDRVRLTLCGVEVTVRRRE